MKKWIFIIMSLILFVPKVYAIEDCTPTDEYLEYLSLSENDRNNIIPPIRCKETLEVNNSFSSKNDELINTVLNAVVTDSRYSAVDDGLVTPVKDQEEDGTCWAFSAVSVVETNALKNGLPAYDLSELHMIYSLVGGTYLGNTGLNGRYNSSLAGGKITYPVSYFFNNEGMLFEDEQPYPVCNAQNTSCKIPAINESDYIQGHDILTVDKFEMINLSSSNSCSASEIYTYKKYISTYGSIQATIHMPENDENPYNYFKENKYYNYYKTNDNQVVYTNHAVAIVGWDDTISKDKFIGATRDGAWIVKNSWDTDWGDNGYFYVSYDDITTCQGGASYQGVSSTNYDNSYKAADLVGVTDKLFNPHTFIATTQTKKSSEDEVIKKVSFATPYSSTITTVNVYVSFEDDWQTDYDSWKLLGTYSGSAFGIDSIYTDIPIESDNYTIIIEYDNKRSFELLVTSKSAIDTSFLTYERDKNYYSENNQSSWRDSTFYSDFEPNIFVYTNNISSEISSITVDSTSIITGGAKVTLSNPNSVEISGIKIFNKNNEEVTTSFNITLNDNEIIIEDSNNLLGIFNIVITDSEGKKCTYLYEFIENIDVAQRYSLDKDLMLILLPQSSDYTDVTTGIQISNYGYDIKNGNTVINSGTIGTGYSLVTPNNTYYFIVIGDVTGDGVVNSGDLMKIVKYLKGTTSLNDVFQLAGDANFDDIINSGDLMKIVKYLKGITTL